MNVFLLPYTWMRHLSMSLWCAGAGLLAWWVVLAVFLNWTVWPPSLDGPILLSGVAAAIAGASLLGEGNLRRMALAKRLAFVGLGMALTVGFTLVWYYAWHFIVLKLVFGSGDYAQDATDPSLVSFTFRIGAFAAAGLASGLGPAIVRKGGGFIDHVAGGLAAGIGAGIAWHLLNSREFNTDLYLAGAGMGLTWGFLHGLLVWGIPDSLYAGWIRVLSARRFGRRIPVDAPDGGPKERFVGHFPRGLDLYLPVDDGVMELHLSVAVDDRQRYSARGLSLQPTLVRRFLERVDLRYDPRRPAPLETRLSSGDRIYLGEGERQAVLEFIMLPREER